MKAKPDETKGRAPALALSAFSIGLVFLAIPLARSAQPPRPPLKSVLAVTQGIIEADNRGDVAAVVGFYADDAILIPPNGPNVEGERAIRKHYQAIFAAADLAIESHPEETWIEGDMAFQRGWNHVAVHAKSTGDVELRRAKYLMILRRVSSSNTVETSPTDGWKIFRLIWTDLALPDAP